MKKLVTATKWEVKVTGKKRSIQLFDEHGNKVDGDKAFWPGYFHCSNNQLTSLEGAPKEVGGSFDCANNQLTTLEGAPKEVGGSFYCYDNQLTSLEGAPKEVGGYFYCHNNQLTSLEGAPKEVGGNFYCYDNQLTSLEGAKPLENSGSTAAIQDLIRAQMLIKGILWADGIMAHVISSRKNVFKIKVYGKKEESFCVYRGGNFSHGKTLKEAIESLRYKASTRDVSEFKSWKKSDTKEIGDLISAYRSITGACEYGVKSFCESISLEKKLTVNRVIEITQGRYGHEQFKNFEWAGK